jgi:hypothetical protein
MQGSYRCARVVETSQFQAMVINLLSLTDPAKGFSVVAGNRRLYFRPRWYDKFRERV